MVPGRSESRLLESVSNSIPESQNYISSPFIPDIMH